MFTLAGRSISHIFHKNLPIGLRGDRWMMTPNSWEKLSSYYTFASFNRGHTHTRALSLFRPPNVRFPVNKATVALLSADERFRSYDLRALKMYLGDAVFLLRKLEALPDDARHIYVLYDNDANLGCLATTIPLELAGIPDSMWEVVYRVSLEYAIRRRSHWQHLLDDDS